MGYTTEFRGQFDITPALGVEHKDVLNRFWDAEHDEKECPGKYCQWVPTDDGCGLQWDENEKFYDYVEWLEYLIAVFFRPWGYVVSGSVRWRGEEFDDVGTITVIDNEVTVL